MNLKEISEILPLKTFSATANFYSERECDPLYLEENDIWKWVQVLGVLRVGVGGWPIYWPGRPGAQD